MQYWRSYSLCTVILYYISAQARLECEIYTAVVPMACISTIQCGALYIIGFVDPFRRSVSGWPGWRRACVDLGGGLLLGDCGDARMGTF